MEFIEQKKKKKKQGVLKLKKWVRIRNNTKDKTWMQYFHIFIEVYSHVMVIE